MVKIVYCISKLPNLGTDEFHRYWRETHGPIAGRIPGVRKYVQSHTIHRELGGRERLEPGVLGDRDRGGHEVLPQRPLEVEPAPAAAQRTVDGQGHERAQRPPGQPGPPPGSPGAPPRSPLHHRKPGPPAQARPSAMNPQQFPSHRGGQVTTATRNGSAANFVVTWGGG